ncbi:hypothetical protein ACFVDI_11545 [Nocardioides sp. NPDC057767]|uniref:hypothetical protein n=1 Tax=unclassified Nocardioides TaxID=2615069 RepID=UPI00366EDFD4
MISKGRDGLSKHHKRFRCSTGTTQERCALLEKRTQGLRIEPVEAQRLIEQLEGFVEVRLVRSQVGQSRLRTSLHLAVTFGHGELPRLIEQASSLRHVTRDGRSHAHLVKSLSAAHRQVMPAA